MKTCTKCKEHKALSEFNKKSRSPDGYNPQCRECIKSSRKEKYDERKAQGLEPITAKWQRDNKDKLNEIRNNRRREIRDFIRSLKVNQPCEMCGGIFPPTCMDFDHLDPTEKDFNICGDATRELYSEEKILAEVAKCRIICANCHRIHSAIQRGEDMDEWYVGTIN